MRSRKVDTAAEFWDLVNRRESDECWPWLGATNGGRPGQVRGRLTWAGRSQYAYRVSFELAYGEPIPDGLVARHTCDNPICVNPHHILSGTQLDNVGDAVERGRVRTTPRYGMDHHLTAHAPDQIRSIVAEWMAGNERQEDVAARHGIPQSTLSRWARGAVRGDTGIQPASDYLKLKPCGSHAAYARHLRRGEKACADCLAAEREHCAIRRAKRNTAKVRRSAA